MDLERLINSSARESISWNTRTFNSSREGMFEPPAWIAQIVAEGSRVGYVLAERLALSDEPSAVGNYRWPGEVLVVSELNSDSNSSEALLHSSVRGGSSGVEESKNPTPIDGGG